ncbi:MAG: nucleotidyltransferase domain-containing protein [Chloroflexota bacterium]
MISALRRWAEKALQADIRLLKVGFFGSYARGDWGVGSDLDVIIIVAETDLPFERRAIEWDLTELPVPVDLLVYTPSEWERLIRQAGFGKRLEREVTWV